MYLLPRAKEGPVEYVYVCMYSTSKPLKVPMFKPPSPSFRASKEHFVSASIDIRNLAGLARSRIFICSKEGKKQAFSPSRVGC